jgi:type III restriction enzyme
MLDNMRPSTVAMHLSKQLVERYFRDGDAIPPYHLVGKLQPITRRWLSECVKLTPNMNLKRLKMTAG